MTKQSTKQSEPSHEPDFRLWDQLSEIPNVNDALAVAASLHKRGRLDAEEFQIVCDIIADAPARRAEQAREAEIAAQAAKDQRQAKANELEVLRRDIETNSGSPTLRATKLLRAHELKKELNKQ